MRIKEGTWDEHWVLYKVLNRYIVHLKQILHCMLTNWNLNKNLKKNKRIFVILFSTDHLMRKINQDFKWLKRMKKYCNNMGVQTSRDFSSFVYITLICNNRDERRGHYAKLNKLNRERQTLYGYHLYMKS